MSRIEILVVIDHMSYNGSMHGGGRFFLNTVSGIDRNRFNIIPCILRDEDPLKQVFENQSIRIRYLRRKKLDPFVLFDFIKIIRDEKIQLIHLHGYGSQIFGRLAGIITGVPTIIHGHGIDYFPSWYQGMLDRFLAKFTAQAIAVSESVKEDYVRRRKIHAGKVIVMPNGIPLEEFKPLPRTKYREIKNRFGLEPDHSVVGTVTRLREEKGNRYLLEAAVEVLKVLPKTYFLLVGGGPLLAELKCLASQLRVEQKVIFAGFCQNIPAVLSIFDVKVMASLNEGLPLALLEAMAVGKPIVATNIGGIREILRDGETGLLVPPRNPQAMADKIIYLLQHEEERARLGSAAYQESRKYGLDTYLKDLERVYEEASAKLVKCSH
jgi:glycosyltransferase involved in cell wall biosynthesis